MLSLNQKKPSALLLRQMAEIQEKLQNFPIAAVYYEEILKRYPDSKHEPVARARLKQFFQSYTESDMLILKQHAESDLTKGIQALEQKSYHKAIVLLKQGLQKQPNNYLLLFYLGLTYYEYYENFKPIESYRNRAINALWKAANITASPKVYNNLACIFAKKNDLVFAYRFFQKAKKAANLPALKRIIEENESSFVNNRNEAEYRFLKESLDPEIKASK
jgi:tetratricopeptide (TPR) repeat protein